MSFGYKTSHDFMTVKHNIKWFPPEQIAWKLELHVQLLFVQRHMPLINNKISNFDFRSSLNIWPVLA